MSLTLYGHPFSAYTWKVLIALYENDTPFRLRVVDNAAAVAELESLWALRKFPVLQDGQKTVIESSVIIEYLVDHLVEHLDEHRAARRSGETRLLPDDRDAALQVRFLDRFFDNYVMTPMQKLVSDRLRAEGERDARGISDAKALLDVAYGWLEQHLADRQWAAGDEFTLADCAAAPALFYADWVHPIAEQFSRVRAYRVRLLARPSVARAVDEARPYRKLFPQGAPDRD
jgi:glutathione S-transferase